VNFSGHEKAAIFLSAIGEDAASEILKNLDIKDVGKLSTHMSRLKALSKSDVDAVFKEVTEKISKSHLSVGGDEYLRKVLSKGLGEESANKILEMASKQSTIDSLRWVDSKTLANFLITEHPQTIALVLCLIEPGQASEVINMLPDALKADVAMRIATTDRIPGDAIEAIEEVLKVHLDVGKSSGKKLGGIKTVAEILNQCDRSTESMILEKIEGANAAVADSIRQLMFVFDDLINVDDRGIQMVLKEVSTEDLSLALKTASEALREKVFKNMSQRAAQILREDMEVKGPVKVSEVEKSQQNIVRIARRLEEEGKIMLGGRGGEELLV
jgi:flagellar motor switch protein FliG